MIHAGSSSPQPSHQRTRIASLRNVDLGRFFFLLFQAVIELIDERTHSDDAHIGAKYDLLSCEAAIAQTN